MPSHYGNGKMSGVKKNGNGAKKNSAKKGGKGSKAMKEKMAKLRAMRGKK